MKVLRDSAFQRNKIVYGLSCLSEIPAGFQNPWGTGFPVRHPRPMNVYSVLGLRNALPVLCRPARQDEGWMPYACLP
jgi:hypothetical protein